MAARPVELRIGGQNYRVVSSASAEELEHLAAIVDDKLSTIVPPGRPLTPQAMLLVAMALAHDVELEKRRVEAMRAHSRASIDELVRELDLTLSFATEALDRSRPAPNKSADEMSVRAASGVDASSRELPAKRS
ncbi:MAG: cell division protein ZapA [Polyangiaceae bacterium]